MSEFSASRLTLARERNGWFRKELASRCGITAQTVSNWETGSTLPSRRTIADLAETLGFPESFFFQDDVKKLSQGGLTFRARSRTPAWQKHSAVAAATMVSELVNWIDERFELPEVRLPRLVGQTPDVAARMVRAEWMLGQKPIPNMIHLLESRGVLVFSLAQNCREIDAFSFWAGERPVVMLNTMKSAERSRMDAAHELMHLIAHEEETGKSEEQEATAFGGNFLLPASDVLARVKRVVSLPQLIEAKRRWGVALSALVYRLHELGIASDWQYRTLFVEMAKKNYLADEPNPIEVRETSSLLAQVFQHLQEQGVHLKDVAEDLSWRPAQLAEFVFGLGATLVPIDGGGSSSRRGRPDLRLV